LLEGEALSKIGIGSFYGTRPWSEVEAHTRRTLAEVERLGQRMLDARQGLAGALAAMARFDEARAIYREHLATVEERGQSLKLLATRQHPAVAELLAGDFALAEAHARAAWDGLGSIGERGYRSTCGGILAEAIAEQGRGEEAGAILDEVDLIAADDDWLTSAQSSWARALIALHAGDLDAAVVLARRATEVADTREYYPTRTHYSWGLARVLVAAGRDGEAREAIAEAQRLSDMKGSVVYPARLRALLEQLEAVR
jgi:tetratricopeptide (TPR) repeat protein